MKRTLTFVFGVVAIFATLVISALAISWYEGSSASWPREPFQPERWRTVGHEQRYRQFKDLREKHHLVGMTKAELVGLLGPPDSDATDGRYMVYDLKDGSDDKFTLNSVYFMRVWLDGHGRVTAVRVGAD